MMRMAAQHNSAYFFFMEDDFHACPNMFRVLQYLTNKVRCFAIMAVNLIVNDAIVGGWHCAVGWYSCIVWNERGHNASQ